MLYTFLIWVHECCRERRSVVGQSLPGWHAGKPPPRKRLILSRGSPRSPRPLPMYGPIPFSQWQIAVQTGGLDLSRIVLSVRCEGGGVSLSGERWL